MANSTSASLKLTVQATGENSGTWGQITNTNLLSLEQAIGGYSSIALNATTGATLTFSNGALSNATILTVMLPPSCRASWKCEATGMTEQTFSSC